MGIMEALKAKKQSIRMICDNCLTNSVKNGTFEFTVYASSVEEGKIYLDCLSEINNEMNGSGYHLLVDSTKREKDVMIHVSLVQDSATNNAAK